MDVYILVCMFLSPQPRIQMSQMMGVWNRDRQLYSLRSKTVVEKLVQRPKGSFAIAEPKESPREREKANIGATSGKLGS